MEDLLCLNLFGPSSSLAFWWLCHLSYFDSSHSYLPSTITNLGNFRKVPPSKQSKSPCGFGGFVKNIFKFTKHLNRHILCHFFTSSMPSKITASGSDILRLTIEAYILTFSDPSQRINIQDLKDFCARLSNMHQMMGGLRLFNMVSPLLLMIRIATSHKKLRY